MKRSGVIACAAAGLAACASFAAGVVPVVSNVTMAQGPSHLVTVEYDLANGPAVVTLDIETNGPAGWASIGLENVYANADSVTGDANRKVAAAHALSLDCRNENRADVAIVEPLNLKSPPVPR